MNYRNAIVPLFAVALLGTTLPASAADPHAGHGAPAPAAQVHQGQGVVRNIDAANNRVTLAHGPISSLDWPGMTMPFNVLPGVLPKDLKVGDNVSFQLRMNGSEGVITSIVKR
ncbi:copper-binding protein [Uliginosibacterium sp. sgz301328]|uniref:copper-binding protein n=1 Tax=Uliginosibacterium sp. sgz301328 TaxID=3243764 RepID=UPI00359E7838